MKVKHIINIATFSILIFGLSFSLLIKKDDLISQEERRYLVQREELKESKFLDGSYSDVLENYALDQFPLRTSFRKIKSFSNYNLFQKIHNQDIVISDGYAIKLPMNYKYEDVEKTIEKINTLQNQMFKYNKCYISLIPDKSCFYDKYDDNKCDFDKVENILKDKINKNITYIPIKDKLELSDYYRTDSHWTQYKIEDAANTILEGMGNKAESKYETKEIEGFYGVYYSQAALTLKPDTIKYLTNKEIESCTVYNYENNKTTSVYDLDKLTDEKSMDNYDIFLSGTAPLLRIDNPNTDSNKTLYVFRDSYGSSLSPLLIHNYKTIYVVDLRYISVPYLKKFINPNKTDDVLFIYSTLLINSPNNFKLN